MEEAGGEKNSELEEEVLREEDATEVLQMFGRRENITQVNQVIRGLINKKFNVIIVKKLVIMHMNAVRNNMTKEGKTQISRPTPTLRRVQC